jgi:hypothetical protein
MKKFAESRTLVARAADRHDTLVSSVCAALRETRACVLMRSGHTETQRHSAIALCNISAEPADAGVARLPKRKPLAGAAAAAAAAATAAAACRA